jgi:hypothetical protein
MTKEGGRGNSTCARFSTRELVFLSSELFKLHVHRTNFDPAGCRFVAPHHLDLPYLRPFNFQGTSVNCLKTFHPIAGSIPPFLCRRLISNGSKKVHDEGRGKREFDWRELFHRFY